MISKIGRHHFGLTLAKAVPGAVRTFGAETAVANRRSRRSRRPWLTACLMLLIAHPARAVVDLDQPGPQYSSLSKATKFERRNWFQCQERASGLPRALRLVVDSDEPYGSFPTRSVGATAVKCVGLHGAEMSRCCADPSSSLRRPRRWLHARR